MKDRIGCPYPDLCVVDKCLSGVSTTPFMWLKQMAVMSLLPEFRQFSFTPLTYLPEDLKGCLPACLPSFLFCLPGAGIKGIQA